MLSGNRNFEGRIHPNTRANYLASPLLVIAYALAGRVDIDFDKEPLGELYVTQIMEKQNTCLEGTFLIQKTSIFNSYDRIAPSILHLGNLFT